MSDACVQQSLSSVDLTVYLERDSFWSNGVMDGRFKCKTSIEETYPEKEKEQERVPFSMAIMSETISFNNSDTAHLSAIYLGPANKRGAPYRWLFNIQEYETKTEWYKDKEASTFPPVWKHRFTKTLKLAPSATLSEGSNEVKLDSPSTGRLQVMYKYDTSPAYVAKRAKRATADPVEISVPLNAKGYDATANEFEVFLVPNDKDEIGCLLCNPLTSGPKKPWKDKSSSYELADELAAHLNWARATHPELCPGGSALEVEYYLMQSAQHYAGVINMQNPISGWTQEGTITGYHSEDGGNFEARIGIWYYQEEYYCVKGESVAIITEIIPVNQSFTQLAGEALANKLTEFWGGADHTIYNPMFDRLGCGIVESTVAPFNFVIIGPYQIKRTIVVAHFVGFPGVDVPTTYELIPEIRDPCSLDCTKKIEWYQDFYETEEYVFDEGMKTVKHPLENLVIPLKQIPFICGMRKIVLIAEESGVKGEYIPPFGSLQPVPLDGSMQVLGVEELEFRLNLSNIAPPLIPGEWIAFVAEVGILNPPWSECNYIVIAEGWFETKCLTSGFVIGSGLIEQQQDTDDEGNPKLDSHRKPIMKLVVIEGGEDYALDTRWIGDERMSWYLQFKMEKFWIRPSDYARYSLGQRVFIYKNGFTPVNEGSGVALKLEAGCRSHSIQQTMETENRLEPLSFSDVSYELDIEKDIVVPEKLATVIGW